MFKIKIYYNKDNKLIRALIVDLGYRVIVLSYDVAVISEILRLSIAQVYELKPGVYDIK